MNNANPSLPRSSCSSASLDLSRFSKIEPQDLDFIGYLTHKLSGVVLDTMFLLKYKLLVQGQEHIPSPDFGSFIVAANHQSYLDIPIVSHALSYRGISYLAKRELFESFLMRHYLRCTRAILVNRGDRPDIAAFRSCKNVLANPRWVLGIFPEGTRSEDIHVGSAKKGAAAIANRYKKSILPIGISRDKPGGKYVSVQMGALIPPDPNQDHDALAEHLMTTIANLKKQAQQSLTLIKGYPNS